MRALGLNPVVSQGANKASYGKRYGKWAGRAVLLLLVGRLMGFVCVCRGDGALLHTLVPGCPYPVFALSWYILPAAIEVGRYRWRGKQKTRRPVLQLAAVSDSGARLVAAREGVDYEDNTRGIGLNVGKPEPASDGIQGAQKV